MSTKSNCCFIDHCFLLIIARFSRIIAACLFLGDCPLSSYLNFCKIKVSQSLVTTHGMIPMRCLDKYKSISPVKQTELEDRSNIETKLENQLNDFVTLFC